MCIILTVILFRYCYTIGVQLENIGELNVTWWYVLFIACGCMGIIGAKYSIHKKIHAKCTLNEYWNGAKCTPITQPPVENSDKEKMISNFFPNYGI